jgi:hypothetical protein
MSDRTQGSVRTGSRAEAPASPRGTTAQGAATDAREPVSAAQPAAAPQRVAEPADGTAPVAGAPIPAAPDRPGGSTASPTVAAGPASAAFPATGGGGASPAGAAPATGTALAPAPDAALPTGTAPVQSPGPAAAKGGGKQKAARGPRRARLQLRHIDTWSALKISLVLSIAMFFIWMVAVGILYGVLSGLGVFETLNDLFGQLGTASGGDGTGEVITPGIVFGGAAVIGAINIVLMTALCTVAAFIYNMCSDLVGGLEVTLSERD